MRQLMHEIKRTYGGPFVVSDPTFADSALLIKQVNGSPRQSISAGDFLAKTKLCLVALTP